MVLSLLTVLGCSGTVAPPPSLDVVCGPHEGHLPLVDDPPKPWDPQWVPILVEREGSVISPDAVRDRDVLVLAHRDLPAARVVDAIADVHRAGARSVRLGAASRGAEAHWPLVDPGLAAEWLPRSPFPGRDPRVDAVLRQLHEHERCRLPSDLRAPCDRLDAWDEALAACAQTDRDRLTTLAQVHEVLSGRGVLPAAVPIELERNGRTLVADSPRTSWGSTLRQIYGADEPVQWLNYPLEATRVDCADVEAHEERLGILQDTTWSTVHGALSNAFVEVGEGHLQTAPGEVFWAGEAELTITFVDVDIGTVRVRPAGCVVFELEGPPDAPRVSQLHGPVDVQVSLPPLEFAASQEARMRVSGLEPDVVVRAAVRAVRASLVDAVRDAAQRLPPGEERLAWFEAAAPFLEMPDWHRIAEDFEPSEAERHLFEYGDPYDLAVEDATTLFGVLPMTVSVDGRALAVEPLPRSLRYGGEGRYGRAVVHGSGIGRLSVRSGPHDVQDAIFTYVPGTWADFSQELFNAHGPRGCLYADRPASGRCFGVVPPGTPILPHDPECRPHFSPRDGQIGALKYDDGDRLPVVHLAPWALEVSGPLSALQLRRSARSCGPDTGSAR
ncbi:MAG: hypothetical protein AAF602_13440 [Myxococcota bacterium]